MAQDSGKQILKAAQSLFIECGGAFEVGKVAKLAGVSVGLVYHYYGSKSGLTAAIIAEFYDRYDAVANQKFEQRMRWRDREFLRLSKVVEFLFHDPLAPLMLGRLSGDAEVMAVEHARREAIIELAVVNIARAQARGEVPEHVDASFAASAINGGIREAASMALRRSKRPDLAVFVKQAWGLVCAALSLSTEERLG